MNTIKLKYTNKTQPMKELNFIEFPLMTNFNETFLDFKWNEKL